MTAPTTLKAEERAARHRLKAIQRAQAAETKATTRRRAQAIRDELARPHAKDSRCPITPQSTPEQRRALSAGCIAGPIGLPDARRDPTEARNMNMRSHRPEQNDASYLGAPSRPPVRERRIPRPVGHELLGTDRSDVAIAAHHPPAQSVVITRPARGPTARRRIRVDRDPNARMDRNPQRARRQSAPAHHQEVKR